MPKRGATCELSSCEAPAKAKKSNNKGKSELCQLAERFEQQFCQVNEIGKDVNLNDVADVLQVSRRRLYDIINVLESLRMVSRGGKLTYRWEGTAHLPRLLDTLYAAAGHSNTAILEGHLPGSCWALTRRVIQQLLLDRGMVPLSALVQRLEATLGNASGTGAAAANAAGAAVPAHTNYSVNAAGGSSSAATVGRRIYDIGSVLSSFGLVQKTLQGGSGPRYRQPVYQWVFEWQSSLPAAELSAISAHAPTAAAAASAGRGGGAGGAGAAGATAAEQEGSGRAEQEVAEQAGQQMWLPQRHIQQTQQQQWAAGVATAAASQGFVHTNKMSMAQQLSSVQRLDVLLPAGQQQGDYQAMVGQQQQAVTGSHTAADGAVQQDLSAGAASILPPAATGAGAALQQRLQQLDMLVASLLSQNGPETYVTLGQLRLLLEHLKQPVQHEQQQEMEQQQQQPLTHTPNHLQQQTPHVGLNGTRQEHRQLERLDANQDELDAAESLQQLHGGIGCCAGELQCCSDKQQQQQQACCTAAAEQDGCPTMPVCCQHACCQPATEDDHMLDMQQLQQVCCAPPPARAAAAKSCRCLGLGMQAGYLQGLAQLRAQFGKHYEERQVQEEDKHMGVESTAGRDGQRSKQQQQQRCNDTAAAAADVNTAAAAAVRTVDASNDLVPDNQQLDCAAFAADEGDIGDQPPDLRVGSNQLNNSQEDVFMKASAAAAVEALQQQQQQHQTNAGAAAAPASAWCSGPKAGAAAGGVSEVKLPQQQQEQQQELSLLEPWLCRAAQVLGGSCGGNSISLADMHVLPGAAAPAVAGSAQQQQYATAVGMSELQQFQHAATIVAGLEQLRNKQQQLKNKQQQAAAAAARISTDGPGSLGESGSGLACLHQSDGAGATAAAAAAGIAPRPSLPDLLAVLVNRLNKPQPQQEQHLLHGQQQQQQESSVPHWQQDLQQLMMALLNSTDRTRADVVKDLRSDVVKDFQSLQQLQQHKQQQLQLHPTLQQQRQPELPNDTKRRLPLLQLLHQRTQQRYGLGLQNAAAHHSTTQSQQLAGDSHNSSAQLAAGTDSPICSETLAPAAAAAAAAAGACVKHQTVQLPHDHGDQAQWQGIQRSAAAARLVVPAAAGCNSAAGGAAELLCQLPPEVVLQLLSAQRH